MKLATADGRPVIGQAHRLVVYLQTGANELTRSAIAADRGEDPIRDQARRNLQRMRAWANRWKQEHGTYPASFTPVATAEDVRRARGAVCVAEYAPTAKARQPELFVGRR